MILFEERVEIDDEVFDDFEDWKRFDEDLSPS